MGLVDWVDRFAALLGISCIVMSILTLYNIAVAKNDTLYTAFIILPVTVLSLIFLKLTVSIYTTSFPPVKISQMLKTPALFKEKEE